MSTSRNARSTFTFARLRLALEPFGQDGLIETVRGSGYRLAAPH